MKMIKSVRFVETSANGVFLLEPDHGLEGATQNWSPSELLMQKEQRKQDIAHYKQSRFSVLLMDTFQKPDPHYVQKCIDTFVRLPSLSCPRGLERQISRQHERERREMRYQCIQNVLDEYDKFYHETTGDADPDAYNDIMWSRLAKVSTESSQNARLFARRLGKADELWIKIGEQDDMTAVSRLIDEIKAGQAKKSSEMNQQASFPSPYHRRDKWPSYHGPVVTRLGGVETCHFRKPEKSKLLTRSRSERTLNNALAQFSLPFEKNKSSAEKSKKANEKVKQTSSPRPILRSTRWHSLLALDASPEVSADKPKLSLLTKSKSDRDLGKALAKFASPLDDDTSSAKDSRKESGKMKQAYSPRSVLKRATWRSTLALDTKTEMPAGRPSAPLLTRSKSERFVGKALAKFASPLDDDTSSANETRKASGKMKQTYSPRSVLKRTSWRSSLALDAKPELPTERPSAPLLKRSKSDRFVGKALGKFPSPPDNDTSSAKENRKASGKMNQTYSPQSVLKHHGWRSSLSLDAKIEMPAGRPSAPLLTRSKSDRLMGKALAKFASPLDDDTSSAKESRKESGKMKQAYSPRSVLKRATWRSTLALDTKTEVPTERPSAPLLTRSKSERFVGRALTKFAFPLDDDTSSTKENRNASEKMKQLHSPQSVLKRRSWRSSLSFTKPEIPAERPSLPLLTRSQSDRVMCKALATFASPLQNDTSSSKQSRRAFISVERASSPCSVIESAKGDQ